MFTNLIGKDKDAKANTGCFECSNILLVKVNFNIRSSPNSQPCSAS